MSIFVFANNISTTLSAALTSTTTTMTLASSANLPALAAGQVMPMTLRDAATGKINEIVYVTDITGATLSMLRGQEGTTALPWAINDYAFCAPTAGSVAPLGGRPSQTLAVGTGVAATDAVNVAQVQAILAATPMSAASAAIDLVGSAAGVISAGDAIFKAITPQPVTLPQNLVGSYAYCDAAPTNDVVCPLSIVRGGVTTAIGSVNFAAGYTTGSFTLSADTTTQPGDMVVVTAPASIDPTFEGPSFGLACRIPVFIGGVEKKSAAYTPVTTDLNGFIVMAAPSAVTCPLPAGTGLVGNFPNGWRTEFKNLGPGAVTFTVPSGASIDGVLNGTATSPVGKTMMVITDGADWFTRISG